MYECLYELRKTETHRKEKKRLTALHRSSYSVHPSTTFAAALRRLVKRKARIATYAYALTRAVRRLPSRAWQAGRGSGPVRKTFAERTQGRRLRIGGEIHPNRARFRDVPARLAKSRLIKYKSAPVRADRAASSFTNPSADAVSDEPYVVEISERCLLEIQPSATISSLVVLDGERRERVAEPPHE